MRYRAHSPAAAIVRPRVRLLLLLLLAVGALSFVFKHLKADEYSEYQTYP
jgi:hypothetical protein